jgi:hypothetical protein
MSLVHDEAAVRRAVNHRVGFDPEVSHTFNEADEAIIGSARGAQ